MEKGIDEINEKLLEERGVEKTYAKIEGDISYVLSHIISPNFTEIQIQYIISAAENATLPVLKARYNAVLVECSYKKQKYEYSIKLIEYVLKDKDEIFNKVKWTLFDLDLLNLMLLISASMNIAKPDIANLSLDYVENNGCLSTIINRFLLLIKKIDSNGDRDYLLNRIEKVYNDLIERLTKATDAVALVQLLRQIKQSKTTFINILPLESAISKSYLNLAKSGSRSLRELLYAQRAAEYAKIIKDDKLEKECLAVLRSLIDNNDIEWVQSKFELSEEENQNISNEIELIKEYFSNPRYCLKDRIKALSMALSISYCDSEGKVVSTLVLYVPIASFDEVKSFVETFKNSVVTRIASISTLGDGKVVNTGFNPFIQAKNTVYSFHAATKILPAIEALESSEDFTMDIVREQIVESKYISDQDIIFIDYALADYSAKRYIPFIHVIVPCIEAIIRNIYRDEIGVDILVKNADCSTQTTANLSDILKNNAFKAKIKEDAYEYLVYLLNDETGENIRNNVAHRLKNAEYYNEYRSRLLMHFLIYLCSIE